MSSKQGDESGSSNTVAVAEKPPVEQIRLPSPEEIQGQDIWNNCAVRSIMSGVMGGGLGVMMGIFFAALDNPIMQDTMTTRRQLAYTAKQMGQRSWSSCKTFALMGLLFSASECVVEKWRAKHDTTNSAIAGCVTGGALAAKGAVATSAMSSRWKTLWTTIDSFEFDDVTLSLRTEHKDYGEGFPRFVKSSILQCDTINVRKFSLSYHGIKNPVFLNDCILFAVSRNVQEFGLNVLNGRDLNFPIEFFSCKSLERLKIEIDYVFDVPLSSHTFPNLKSLHIQFKCADPKSFRKLLSCCPKLEDLAIHAGPRYWEHLQRKDSGCKITVKHFLDNMLLSPEDCFPNLARLEITISDFIVRVMLPHFIRACPDLNVLKLRMEHAEKSEVNFSRSFFSEWSKIATEEVPTCLLKQLKEITIKSYKDVYQERKLIKYLLDCSAVLQKMSIHVLQPGLREQLSQRIPKVPRTSKKCQIKVV